MDNISIKLYVLFEDPFWIGIFEKEYKEKLYACKVTFGKEPKDYEVYDYLLRNYNKLTFTKNSVDSYKTINEKINPKRLQRKIKKELSSVSIGTKSQQALKKQYEENKIERKSKRALRKEEEKERKFKLKQEKKKKKHKGR